MPSVPPYPGEKPQQLPSLPGAEEEAKAIASLLNTKAIVGKDATKSAITQLMPKARIIHLATHGLLDDVRGIGSAIVLTPEGNDDGLYQFACMSATNHFSNLPSFPSFPSSPSSSSVANLKQIDITQG
jgi:CHAT domain-containing protein